ncbi:MAG TPA: ABC transporter permease subunit [Candidatus Limnocylindrales bacterium]|jgi:NitT/TauT family transport system permease protein|nr:ABC transporter permease subunit [Candidatus Limnocylindrales bacterium]
MAVAARSLPARRRFAGPGRRARIALTWLAIVAILVIVWEGAKWLFGDPWRIHTTFLGLPIDIEHKPPMPARIARDLSLPHIWDVVGAFAEPAQRNGAPLGVLLAGQAWFTFREALIGFAVGGLLGLLLGIGFVHSRLAERAFVPYVVASQTVPILAISPLIVVATKAGWVSVAIISAYLTFFPVTIAALRGLRAADARAFELMRSYAAGKLSVLWKLRLPTSVPYLFSSLRVAAAASVIGALIGELPSGIPDGLGASLLNYNQYYTSGPERLWATIIACSILGLAFVGLVRLAELLLTRNRYRPAAGS